MGDVDRSIGGKAFNGTGGLIEIEKFNGQNFELWKLMMEDLLVDKDQRIAVDLGTKPTTTLAEDWEKLD